MGARFGIVLTISSSVCVYNMPPGKNRFDTVYSVGSSRNAPIASDNLGRKMLEKMGWESGNGLGRNNQGMIDNPLWSNRRDVFCKTGLKSKSEMVAKETLTHQNEFDHLLGELNASHNNLETDNSHHLCPEKTLASKRRVRYSKMARAKDISNYSVNDFKGIIGKDATEKNLELLCSHSTTYDNMIGKQKQFSYSQTSMNYRKVGDGKLCAEVMVKGSSQTSERVVEMCNNENVDSLAGSGGCRKKNISQVEETLQKKRRKHHSLKTSVIDSQGELDVAPNTRNNVVSHMGYYAEPNTRYHVEPHIEYHVEPLLDYHVEPHMGWHHTDSATGYYVSSNTEHSVVPNTGDDNEDMTELMDSLEDIHISSKKTKNKGKKKIKMVRCSNEMCVDPDLVQKNENEEVDCDGKSHRSSDLRSKKNLHRVKLSSPENTDRSGDSEFDLETGFIDNNNSNKIYHKKTQGKKEKLPCRETEHSALPSAAICHTNWRTTDEMMLRKKLAKDPKVVAEICASFVGSNLSEIKGYGNW